MLCSHEFLCETPQVFFGEEKWIKPASSRTFETMDPGGREVLVHVYEAVAASVEAVSQAFWRATCAGLAPGDRATFLLRLAVV
jgi:acyl-CoA reductase-like NAD-dependent aldehyde dehydrogenase